MKVHVVRHGADGTGADLTDPAGAAAKPDATLRSLRSAAVLDHIRAAFGGQQGDRS